MADDNKYRYIYVPEKSEKVCAKCAIVHVFIDGAVIAVIAGGKFETENAKLAAQLKKLGYNMAKMVIEEEVE